ncbi:Lrp/AsnC family transcriptional regulator [Nocardia halotolerans]|uniref:Lrp/AsnC family transcriptional regulator n=1 Tax=Nocardia halotolerans TaxID=1755878 RepID=A0ABV8VQ06_9NOCA
MVESGKLDADDRRVLHALQLDPRASFARIGTVLGLSERTVSRRYHRLRSQLILRIVGHEQTGRADWLLQIMTAPAAVDAVSRALAARRDTSWIAHLAGTGGLSCILRTTATAGDALEQLRRMPGIGSVTAQRLLAPVAGVGGWPGRLQALTPEEQRALIEPERRAPSVSGTGRLPTDEPLLSMLAADGRMSIARLARGSGMPESTVRRRISELTARGVLMFEVEVDPKLYGRGTDVLCWLTVRPAAVRAVSEALNAHSEVAFAATTTGDSNVMAILELTDSEALHHYLADSIGALAGVERVRTEIVSDWIKRAGPLPMLRR